MAHKNSTTLPKERFAGLLQVLVTKLDFDETQQNMITTGICPLARNKILSKLPYAAPVQNEVSCVNNEVLSHLKENRLGEPDKDVRGNKKRIPVKPGKSVSLLDFATPGTSKQPEL